MSWQRIRIGLTLLCALALAACARAGDPDSGMGSEDAGDAAMMVTDVAHADGIDAPSSTCAMDMQCATSPAGHVCDPVLHHCVQCVATNDTCPVGSYCDGTMHACVPGCRNEHDCQPGAADGGVGSPDAMLLPDGAVPNLGQMHCLAASHRCVQCTSDMQCPLGSVCRGDNTCAPGCDPTHACPSGLTCCSGMCLNTQTDSHACGACGLACVGMANSCCAAHCTSTNGDVNNCGACGHVCMLPHAVARCGTGACSVASCADGYADLDNNPANGCECAAGTNPTSCTAATQQDVAVGAMLTLTGVVLTPGTDQWFYVSFAAGGSPRIDMTTNPGGVHFNVLSACDPMAQLSCLDRAVGANGITTYEFSDTPGMHTTRDVMAPTRASIQVQASAMATGCNPFVLTVSN